MSDSKVREGGEAPPTEDEFYEKIALLSDSIDDLSRLPKRDFLAGVFEATFTLIPEAEKGSLYELLDGVYRPVFSRGYDIELIQKLSFPPEKVFIDFEVDGRGSIDAYESRIESRDEAAFDAGTIAVFKALGTYSGFISLHAPVRVDGRNAGLICLENFDGRGFSRMSKKILKLYARVISDFYTQLVRGEHELKLYAEKFDSLQVLAAGVAHELNTPLGAIGSSAASLRERLDCVIPRVATLKSALDPGEYLLVEDLIRAEAALGIDTPAPREPRRRIAARLAEAGSRRADELGEILSRMGRDRLSPEFLALATGPLGEEVAELLIDLDDIRRILAVTQTATAKAAAIVKSLWTWTQLRGDWPSAPFDMATQLEAVLAAMGEELAGVSVVRDFATVPRVHGNEDRLRQVWTNLIRNAVQSMDGRGRLVIGLSSAELTLEGSGLCAEGVRVTIADEGHGIAPEIRSLVYDPFFTTRGPGRGSGLGLSLAKAIIEAYAGRISFESPPRGTTFTVTLPLASGAGWDSFPLPSSS